MIKEKKPLRYKSYQEDIEGEPEDVLRFKRQQYYFKIALRFLSVLLLYAYYYVRTH